MDSLGCKNKTQISIGRQANSLGENLGNKDLPPQKERKCKLILPKPTIEEIPDDNEWKNQTINSINDDMDLLISYIDSDMDRNVWINAKSTMATEIQAEINLKKKVLPLEEQIPKEFHDFLDVFSKE